MEKGNFSYVNKQEIAKGKVRIAMNNNQEDCIKLQSKQ